MLNLRNAFFRNVAHGVMALLGGEFLMSYKQATERDNGVAAFLAWRDGLRITEVSAEDGLGR